MEIQFYGANCLRINIKRASIVVDDNLAELGRTTVTKSGDIALFTSTHAKPVVDVRMVIDQPGEYEVANVSLQGIAARAHIDEPGQESATIFRIIADDIRAVVLGHIYPELSDEVFELIGAVDVLLVPVGGNGFTLDSVGALKIIRQIGPKIIIPTHYAERGINFPVPQQELQEALSGLAMEPRDTLDKLKVKANELGESTQLIVLKSQ